MPARGGDDGDDGDDEGGGTGCYDGSNTTGFVSPAGDAIEGPIDLAHILDLRRPHRYPVRVSGDVLVCQLAWRRGQWWLRPAGLGKQPVAVEGEAEIWAIVAGLVRTDV